MRAEPIDSHEVPSAPVPLALSVRGLRKSYGQHHVLRGVDLDIARGNVVAVIGPSGSGKSTFIRCLNLLEQPEAGEVYLNGDLAFSDGRYPAPARVRSLRLRVGMVFQSFNLFSHLTALENIVIAQTVSLSRPKPEATERARDLLAKVGLADRENHRPAQLSGGQQQRVAIARALALDPDVMLFDEPTSAIDPELRVEVLRVMRDLAATGMTMVVVTHELKFAKQVADHVAFFADGDILEFGSPADVLGNPQHARTRRFLSAVEGDL